MRIWIIFLENIQRISSDEYMPTNQDIVRSRQFTIGASTTTFFTQHYWWKIVDVGGQIPERKKWTAIVNEINLNGLIYFVAMDGFDIESVEETGKNCMEVSLRVWGEVMGAEEFKNKMTLLFLNKMDSFEEKMETGFDNFKKVFGKYQGTSSVEETSNYVKDLFVKKAVKSGQEGRNIFAHFTCAIDGEKVGTTWKCLYEYILTKNIDGGGLFEM